MIPFAWGLLLGWTAGVCSTALIVQYVFDRATSAAEVARREAHDNTWWEEKP